MPFDVIGVRVNGIPTSTTLPLTDLHAMAHQTFSAKLPEIMARSVARRVIKKGAVYVAKDQLNASADRVTRYGRPWCGVEAPSQPIHVAGDYYRARFRFCDWNFLVEHINWIWNR